VARAILQRAGVKTFWVPDKDPTLPKSATQGKHSGTSPIRVNIALNNRAGPSTMLTSTSSVQAGQAIKKGGRTALF
jgi:hypothetical protein